MGHEHFLNREWSWLEFNRRVLDEAGETDNPLLERCKFAAIAASNLEEFFMVRVAAVRTQRAASCGQGSDGRLPGQQLEGIRSRVLDLLAEQYRIVNRELLPALAAAGVRVLARPEDLEPYRAALAPFFASELAPVLTPLSVGPTHPFPNLVTGRLYLALAIEPDGTRSDDLERSQLSFLEIPTGGFGRFHEVEPGVFAPIGWIVRLFAADLYGGYRIVSIAMVKATRDADFSVEEDAAADLMAELEAAVKQLHHRSVVKLEHERGLGADVRAAVMESLGIGEDAVYAIDGLLNLQDLWELYRRLARPELKDAPLAAAPSAELGVEDVFAAIRDGERLLFHPYHAYDPVLAFLDRAADDPDVLAIKQTLYRTSADSPVIAALVRAAERGKYVSVVVELKARFDERRNIAWAKALEDAGAHVVYGLAGLKTHAKALLVVRKEAGGMRRYVHLGTGNYNETTARLYTDFSLFTADEDVGEDVAQLFNLMTGFSYPAKRRRLAIAPLDLRERFTALLRREAEHAKNGLKARVTAMMNSFADEGLAEEVYAAARAGVKVQLLVRGVCILRPGKKGLSENIEVRSVVGRFLQHARVYSFRNGGEEEWYLASADWMTRNLDRRVELLFPVRDPGPRAFLGETMRLMWEDTANAWELAADGSYRRAAGKKEKDCFVSIHKLVDKLERERRREAAGTADETPVFRPISKPR